MFHALPSPSYCDHPIEHCPHGLLLNGQVARLCTSRVIDLVIWQLNCAPVPDTHTPPWSNFVYMFDPLKFIKMNFRGPPNKFSCQNFFLSRDMILHVQYCSKPNVLQKIVCVTQNFVPRVFLLMRFCCTIICIRTHSSNHSHVDCLHENIVIASVNV